MTTPKEVIDAIKTHLGSTWTWDQVCGELEDSAALAALGFGDDDLKAIMDAHTVAALGAGDRLALVESRPANPERAQKALLVASSDLEDIARLRGTVAAFGLEPAAIRLAAAVRKAAESLAAEGDTAA